MPATILSLNHNPQGPSLFFCTLASRTLTLGLLLSERIVYVQFVRLLIYPSIASNGKQGKNGYIRNRKKGGFRNKRSISAGNSD